jgi:hypothetical protein
VPLSEGSMGKSRESTRHDLLNPSDFPASDDALVDALLEFANGAQVTMLSGPRSRPVTDEEKGRAQPPAEVRDRFIKVLELAIEDIGKLCEQFLPLGMELLTSLKPRPVIQFGTSGFQLDYFNDFPNLEAALTYAVMLILDARKPYGAALCRCQLPTCGRFYLARRKKKGGPANRVYCSPRHRTEHHNSAERKAASKPQARHK